MYAITLKKQQKENEQELLADANTDSATERNLPELDDFEPVEITKEEKIKRAKRALNNFKYDLSQNTASLVARRNLTEAIALLEADLRKMGVEP